MRTHTITLTLVAISTILTAQSVENIEKVKALFEDTTKIQWVNQYQGLVNDIHDIAIILGFDGEKYHGYIDYLRSNTRFQLYGKKRTVGLKLYEIDEWGKVAGIISGRLGSQGITANWNNRNNQIGASLQATKTSTINTTQLTACGENKWTQNYSGFYLGEPIQLLVQHQSEDYYNGFIYLKKENKTYPIEGTQQANENTIYLHLHNDKRQKIGGMECAQLGEAAIKCTLRNDEGNYLIDLKSQHQIQTQGVEFMDYTTIMEMLYPSIKGQDAFNDYAFRQFDNWLNATRRDIHAQNQNISPTPDNRASLRAYAWYDIEYISDRYISVRMTFTDTWSDHSEVVWTYDTTEEKVLTADDLFLPNTDYTTAVQTYISQELQKRPDFKDPDYSKWIKKENFQYFTLRHEGIDFSTPYNPIYGARHVTVPYEQLKRYLKKVIY